MALKGRRVLVVDDEASITDLVAMALGLHGAEVEVAHTGADALDAIHSFRPHLVVLDVMLPDLDGFEILGQLNADRRSAQTPVLFLTARDGLDDRLHGLAAGGDDYMTKPFSVEEMVLRIDAVLRRTQGVVDERPVVAVGDLQLDEDTHQVWRAGTPIELTPTEFRLLHYLMLNEGQVVSKSQIRERVWESSAEGRVNMVEVYISYLRRKLDALGPSMIRTVRGLGYCLRKPETKPEAMQVARQEAGL